MAFIIYADMSVEDREKILQNQCTKKEVKNYSRTLQDSEVEYQEKQYAQDGIQRKQLKDEMENVVKDFKTRISNIDDRMEERLEKIKNRKATISGTLYGIADHHQKRMMFHDKFGELIDSRELLPDEQQGRLFILEAKPVSERGKGEDIPFEDNTGTNAEPVYAEVIPQPAKDEEVAPTAPEMIPMGGSLDQTQMDGAEPLTIEMLQAAAKERALTPDEQEQLQAFNALSKRAKKKQ